MKVSKKILSILLICMSIVCVFSNMITVSAVNPSSNDKIELQVRRDGNKLVLDFVAKEDMDKFSIEEIDIGYDNVVYEYGLYASVCTEGNVVDWPNESKTEARIWNTRGIDIKAGQSVLSVVYNLKSDFAKDTDYSFSTTILSLSDVNDNLFVGNSNLDITYNEATYYTVNFYNNGSVYNTQSVAKNSTVTEPAAPTNTGFEHWSATVGGEAYSFNAPVTGDLNLYAVYDASVADVNKNVDLSSVAINKNVIAADGVTVNETFTFKLEGLNSVDGNAAPVLSDITITANGSGEFTANLPASVEFAKGGVYQYKITEVDNETANWTFDDTEYYLYLTVEENTESKLVLTHYMITTDATNTDAMKKADSLTFENEYVPMTTLTVTNTVEGNPENATKEFTFTITFEDPDVSGKVTVNGNEIAYDAPYEFKLKDGENATFTLPAGTKYTITENGETYYTPAVTVTENDEINADSTKPGDYEQSLTTSGTAVELDNGKANKAEFENTYSITPPTGLTFNNEMLVILGLVLVALTGTVVVNRKLKKIRE